MERGEGYQRLHSFVAVHQIVMLNLNIKKFGGIALAALVVFVVFSGMLPNPSGKSQAAAVATYANSQNALDWIIKSICVDSSDRPVPADPYYDCPVGTTLRKIQLGDPLPYYNFDQGGGQRSDAYPVLDKNFQPLYMQTFDFAPFNEFSTTADGFDYYTFRDGWFSAPGTRDGGGYGIEFFGADCGYGNGWVFFPLSGFQTPGEGRMAIAGKSWEQNGHSFPGPCPTGYEYPLTKWGLQSGVSFGGAHGNPIKVMDSVVAYHGFEPDRPTGMEVFYFTEQYGKARWEYWVPATENPVVTTNCIVPDTVYYLGVAMKVKDCRDWTNVELATDAVLPKWPISATNMLASAHFDDSGGFDGGVGTGPWYRGGNSAEGNIINWSLRNSTSAADIRTSQNGAGVRYLLTNCGGTCTGPGVQQIYQEIPMGRIGSGATFLYGVQASTESGRGTIRITLQQLNDSGNVLWQDHIEDEVSEYNGTASGSFFTDSPYLSAKFIHKTVVIPAQPGATKLRYIITPMTSNTFHIVHAWLSPFPATSKQFGEGGTPTVSLDANGVSALSIYNGDLYALNWNSSNVAGCTMNYSRTDGYEPKEGYFYVTPNAAGSGTSGMLGTYTLTCVDNSNKSATAAVQISAIAAPPSISADPSTVPSGGRTTIKWSAPASSSCTYSSPTNSPTDYPYGPAPTNGGTGVGPLTQNATYVIVCDGQKAVSNITVFIKEAEPKITAIPDSVGQGGRATVSWSAPEGSSCVYSTPNDAPSDYPYGAVGATGATGVGPLTKDATYTITCGEKISSATVKVTPPPFTPSTYGYVDLATCAAVRGWAQDKDAPTTSIDVHLYIDSQFVAAKVAKINRSDLCTAIGSCNHGYAFAVPSKYRDGKKHNTAVYGIDTDGVGEHNQPLLPGTNVNPAFKCSGAAATTTAQSASIIAALQSFVQNIREFFFGW